jgi:hypothetical protein
MSDRQQQRAVTQAQEAALRTEGVEKLFQFLEHLLPEDLERDRAALLKRVEHMTLDEFKQTLKTINGLLNNLPRSKRKLIPEGTRKVAVPPPSMFAKVDIVFPSQETSNKLLEWFFYELQKIIHNNPPDAPQITARALYHLVVYLHPFRDGNGRTARLLYALFSPHVQRTDSSREDLKKVVSNRHKGINDYHNILNLAIFNDLCVERGLTGLTSEETVAVSVNNTEDLGFDAVYLRFLAIYDILSKEERDTLLHKEGEEQFFDQDELSAKIKERATVRMEAIRTEFARSILQMTLTENEYPEWLDEDLDQAFNI